MNRKTLKLKSHFPKGQVDLDRIKYVFSSIQGIAAGRQIPQDSTLKQFVSQNILSLKSRN